MFVTDKINFDLVRVPHRPLLSEGPIRAASYPVAALLNVSHQLESYRSPRIAHFERAIDVEADQERPIGRSACVFKHDRQSEPSSSRCRLFAAACVAAQSRSEVENPVRSSTSPGRRCRSGCRASRRRPAARSPGRSSRTPSPPRSLLFGHPLRPCARPGSRPSRS
jgi:hypothetical protein